MKKILMVLLAAVMALGLFSFTACDNRPVLKMATNAAFAPFEYKDGNKFVGIDVELAQLIADELGYKLVINDMDFDAVILSVSNGQSDIAMAALTVSPDRAEHVNFSDSYFNASQYLIVKSDNTAFDDCETAADVEAVISGMGTDAKIGFQTGTTGQYYAEGDEDWGFDGFSEAATTGYTSGGIAVNELIAGRLNIVVIDEMPARTLVELNSGVKLINIPLTEEEYAIGVKKGDAELLEKINAALNKFLGNGAFQAIVDRYYGSND